MSRRQNLQALPQVLVNRAEGRPGERRSEGQGERRERQGSSREGGGSESGADYSGLGAHFAMVQRQVVGWKTVALRMPASPGGALNFTVDSGNGARPDLRSQITIDPKSGSIEKTEMLQLLQRGTKNSSLGALDSYGRSRRFHRSDHRWHRFRRRRASCLDRIRPRVPSIFQTKGSCVLRSTAAQPVVEIPLVAVLTFVLWTVTCGIAVVGVLVPYVRPHLYPRKEIVLTAETLQVQLTSEPIADPALELPKNTEPPPTFPPIVQPVETPSFTAVADPAVVAIRVAGRRAGPTGGSKGCRLCRAFRAC